MAAVFSSWIPFYFVSLWVLRINDIKVGRARQAVHHREPQPVFRQRFRQDPRDICLIRLAQEVKEPVRRVLRVVAKGFYLKA
jgi:hypothetical protein